MDYQQPLEKRGFLLKEWIGGGSYGNVYKAIQRSLNRPVAIKFFDNHFRLGDADRHRFSREAKLLARAQHPCIPYVITTGEVVAAAHRVPYTVMQFVEGPTLVQRLALGKPLKTQTVYNVMRDVLLALEHAHQNAVIHRDVKPDNIVLGATGNYVIDFSIGICLKYEPGLTRATTTGERLGHVDHASPEQMADSSLVDLRTDIYSAGVVLAQMLGARARLRLDTLDAELDHVSEELRAVIRVAAADSPDERYHTATDFLAGLENVIGPGAYGDIVTPHLALCPNTTCAGAAWSNGSGIYYWGPRIVEATTDRFCTCGTEFVVRCSGCRRPLPPDIGSCVVKFVKSDRDALEAHCGRCGTLLFRTPTCKKCGSYLTTDDMANDTADGCAKCKPTPTNDFGPPPMSDDDVPF